MGDTSADAFKFVAALVLFLIALVGGILPLQLQDVGSKVVSCLNTAAGGVFFASAMVHMLPESSETLQEAWGDVFPWGGFLCAVGFLLILCIDQAVSISNASRNGRASHTLIPTEPPLDGALTSFVGRGRHAKSESEDLSELMSGISPHALLAPSSISYGGEEEGEEEAGAGGRRRGDDEDGVDGMDHRHRHPDSSKSNNGSSNSAIGGRGGRGRRAPSDSDRSVSGGHAHDHGNGHSHGHSHGLGKEGDGVWVRVALLLALSVHSVMEGLGVGAKSTKAYNLLFAIGVHKGLAAYALGASLLQSNVRGTQFVGFVIAFSAMTPAGILLGTLIKNDGEDDTAGATCVALAAGTFLYVSLMEVLPPELGSTEHGWSKMASLLLGFSISAGVGWLVG